jgi:hypothetical protein
MRPIYYVQMSEADYPGMWHHIPEEQKPQYNLSDVNSLHNIEFHPRWVNITKAAVYTVLLTHLLTTVSSMGIT